MSTKLQRALLSKSGKLVNARMVGYKKRMKRKPTPAEKKMKALLQLAGIRYMAQKGFFCWEDGLGFFIADFYLPNPLKVVVEVDGAQHQKQVLYDTWRSSILAERGIRVVRFTNRQVLKDCESVIKSLLELERGKVRRTRPANARVLTREQEVVLQERFLAEHGPTQCPALKPIGPYRRRRKVKPRHPEGRGRVCKAPVDVG